MERRPIPTVIYVIAAVVLASMIVLIATQYERAEEAEAYAERTQVKLDTAEVDLEKTKAMLTAARAELSATTTRLTETSRSLRRTSSQHSTQTRTCRYLVRVNDALINTSTAYGSATTYLLADRLRPAERALGRAARHARSVQTLVKRSGNRTISQLVQRCAPASS
jgi:hypothetical protein